ncbi:MAG: glycosyltransferase [Pedobacter sp.]|uniref:glycosyltransferase family 2 protein n=1 Tax=Pedobacter sp. TaxID=1411316 RepID=UPI00339427CD
MKISVVIPTYERPALLINCLTALSNQQLPHSEFEVIIVADGPDAATLASVTEWQHAISLNLTFIQAPRKGGPAAARNIGWRAAHAELIAFTDDDCLPQPGWLLALAGKYQQEEYIAYTGKTIVPPALEWTDFANNTSHLEEAEFITANCACTKKALLRRGGFDEHYKMAWREDSDLHFGLISDGVRIIKNEDAVVIHPVRKAPWGISLREQRKGIYDALLFKKYPSAYRKSIQQHPNWNYYLSVICWLIFLLAAQVNSVSGMSVSAAVIIVCFVIFFKKRIKYTSRSKAHLSEMLITSLIIPFLSLFWRACGCIKFHVFFL